MNTICHNTALSGASLLRNYIPSLPEDLLLNQHLTHVSTYNSSIHFRMPLLNSPSLCSWTCQLGFGSVVACPHFDGISFLNVTHTTAVEDKNFPK